MSKSTGKRRKAKADQPTKPYPDFPLTPHASGKWMKKIRGKIYYFGNWGRRVDGKLTRVEGDGWQQALELYKAQADDLHAGRTPRVTTTGEGLTVGELRERFLTAKSRALDAGDIGARMYAEYRQTADRLRDTFGDKRLVDDLAADDFAALRAELAKRYGPTRLGNEITRVKTIFKYGYEAGLIVHPVRYGPEFKKPSAAVMRRNRAKNGERMLEPEQIRALIDAADQPMKAMILLGANCAFGCADVAGLPTRAVDLKGGWVDFPRPKTGIPRRCPLWPETIAALNEAIATRPEPRTDAARGLLFLTSRGRAFLSSRGAAQQANPVSVAARVLMDEVDAARAKAAADAGQEPPEPIHRPGIGFYTLRHVFRTVADGARDSVAIDRIMGHADPSMGAVYRERIDDDRLQAVAEHVRRWLFGNEVE